MSPFKPPKKKFYTCSVCQKIYNTLDAMFDCEESHENAQNDPKSIESEETV